MKKRITFFITLCVMATLFFVGTDDGSKIVKAGSEVIGNLNSDDIVDAEDMDVLGNYLVGADNTVTEATQADVNGDELADVRDLIRYKRYLIAASTELSGTGTEEAPYLISSLADMYKFLSDSQSDDLAGTYYKVTEDIVVNVGDATSLDPTKALVREWNTIGTSGTTFSGTLNGDGKTISGIYLSEATDLTNLLGWANAGTVTGLHVDSSNINPTFSATTSVKYEGATVTNSEIPSCEASITTGEDTVFYKAFTDAMTQANSDTESQMVDVVVLKDVTLSAKVDISRNITIKNASGKTVTIKSDIPSNSANMFYANKKVKFGLQAQRNGDLGALIIDANNVSTSQSAVQIVHTGGEFYLGEYVTIKNAKNPNGGALRNKGIAILEGNMTDNVTTRAGGAIYNEGTLTINKGTYSGNQCANPNEGGGVIYNKGTVTINGGTFSRNKDTDNGGGVIYNTSTVTINGGQFSDNTGTTKGAVINSGAGTVKITGGTFSGNTVTGNYGGAIYNSGTSEMSISGATFSGNNALYGGAIYNNSSNKMTISNTNFNGNGYEKINSQRINGGAIYHEGGIMTITKCTFTANGGAIATFGNKITLSGGAMYCKSSSGISISDSLFTDNLAGQGGAICVEVGPITLNGVTMTGNRVWNQNTGGGALYLMGTSTASIKKCNIAENRWLNYGANVDISFTSDGTCTLYLSDDTFTKGYLGCYLTDATGNSSNKYILREGTEYAIPYNQQCKVDYTDDTAEDATDTPDYSDSVHELNIYAHRSTSNGTFIDLDGTKLDYGDYRTKERFQEYKDCGFNVLYVQENNYNGEPFATSDTKKCLDLAEEVGLKCIFIDARIRELSRSKVSLIGEGAQFATLEALANQLSTYMAPYIDHPAFYGLATVDEPEYLQLQATCEVYKALKMVDEDIYVKTTLSPYKESNSVLYYTGKDDYISSLIPTSFTHYKTYIKKYLQESGTGLLSYDDYPFRTDSFLNTYFRNLQYNVTAAAENGADVELVVQSFAHVHTRLPDLNELYLQNNAALAFGVKNLGYFTYWRAGGDTMTGGILDYDGSKMIYDEVQEVIAYTRKMANVMLNFDYEKAYVTYDSANSKPNFFTDVESQKLDNLTVEPVTQPTIVTQMKDKTNDRTGYMVVNVQSSVKGLSQPEVVALNFEGYNFATYYIGNESKTVSLQDGKFKFVLEEGEGVFVIPHN